MLVRDVMTRDVVTVDTESSLKDVIELMVRAGVSGIPVVDDQGRLLGLVTEADVISKEAYGGRRHGPLALLADVLSGRDHRWAVKASGLKAGDVMTPRPVVCRPEEEVATVARRMLGHHVKRMPVVDDGHLEGIVSRQDILATFARSDEDIGAEVDRVLASHPNMPDERHVRASVEDGIVTLIGDVRYDWDDAAIVSIVRDVPGVLDVVSHLRHRERAPRGPTSPWASATMWPTAGRG